MLGVRDVCAGIIGLNEDDAVAIIRAQGYWARVVRRNDIPYCVRRESDRRRINLHVDDGVVTLATCY